ncbi:hypothetical protein O9929_18470 [Vibrio lentus]|nr:hypothetical protein [Vibrio lentus]
MGSVHSLSIPLRVGFVLAGSAEAASSMSYRGVATMAFALALSANIGVETQRRSFRDTTDKWLTQRLAADLYIYPTNAAARRRTGCREQPEVDSVRWRWERCSFCWRYPSSQYWPSEGELEALTIKLGDSKLLASSTPPKRGPTQPINVSRWYHLMAARSARPTGLGSGWQVVGVYLHSAAIHTY